VFFIVFVPIGLDRLVTAINPQIVFPDNYIAFAVCTFSTNGFFNAMMYGYTRKVFLRSDGDDPGERRCLWLNPFYKVKPVVTSSETSTRTNNSM